MLILNIRVFGRDLIENLMEQTIGLLHDVVFGETCHLLTTIFLGIFKCISDDLFTAGTADQFQALYHFIGLLVLDTGIKIFFIFPDDHQIHIGVLRRDKWM